MEAPDDTFTAKQIEAMRNFALYVTDDLGRKGFLSNLKALSDNGAPNKDDDERLSQFKSVAFGLKTAFKQETKIVPSRAPLTVEDILKLPNFVGKTKTKKKRITPTMNYVLSGAEHREAIEMKERGKEQSEKEKLEKKAEREENKRKKMEQQERIRLQREIAKVENERKKEAKKFLALQKLEREEKKRKHSDSEDDAGLTKEMQDAMRKADEDDVKDEKELVPSDKCSG